MPNFSTGEVILVRYPFSDLTASKVRPAVVVGQFPSSPDYIIVPLTSRTSNLAAGEFILSDWSGAGLNVESAAKRGIYTVHSRLIQKSVGHLATADAMQLEKSLRLWLQIT